MQSHLSQFILSTISQIYKLSLNIKISLTLKVNPSKFVFLMIGIHKDMVHRKIKVLMH